MNLPTAILNRITLAFLLSLLAIATATALPHLTSQKLATKTTPTTFPSAPDTIYRGNYSTTSQSYRLPPTTDPSILPNNPTEIWGQVYRPDDLSDGPFPIILFLHGNHETCEGSPSIQSTIACEYTFTGNCSSGATMANNHLGFSYVADHLASWGYIVISINANRGITCGDAQEGDPGLILARGRLILKHLQYLHQWNTSEDAPSSLNLGSSGFKGKLDLTNVGLVGHSRSAEGARAAYNLYNDPSSSWQSLIPNLKIKGIFEIGGVDRMTDRLLDANGTSWMQLIPMCDGDVRDLQGRSPFIRMSLNTNEVRTAQKSVFYVWGANHNFFNTEWKHSDAEANNCYLHSPIFDPKAESSEHQQLISIASMTAFFRSHVGRSPVGNPLVNKSLNPLHALPETLSSITRIEREFTSSPGDENILRFEEFSAPAGINSNGPENIAKNVNVYHYDIPDSAGVPLRVGAISWSWQGLPTYFQTNWTQEGIGKNILHASTLDFSVHWPSDTSRSTPMNFGISLVDGNNRVSREVDLTSYANVIERGHPYTTTFQTVRIPLSVFYDIDRSNIRGVRFNFNRIRSGLVYLRQIRISRDLGVGTSLGVVIRNNIRQAAKRVSRKQQSLTARKVSLPSFAPRQIISVGNSLSIEGSTSLSLSNQEYLEIKVSSTTPFQVRDAFPTLRIGTQQFRLGRFPESGRIDEMIFKVPVSGLQNMDGTEPVMLEYDGDSQGMMWSFPNLREADIFE